MQASKVFLSCQGRHPPPPFLKKTLINPLQAWGGHSGLLKAVNLNQPLVS